MDPRIRLKRWARRQQLGARVRLAAEAGGVAVLLAIALWIGWIAARWVLRLAEFVGGLSGVVVATMIAIVLISGGLLWATCSGDEP